MSYTVTSSTNVEINLAPATEIEEILRNVSIILSTIKNTVPLNRDFGISARFLDKPTPAAVSILIAEIYDAIEAYEPRAKIKNISFEHDETAGKIIPSLEVEINVG